MTLENFKDAKFVSAIEAGSNTLKLIDTAGAQVGFFEV
jgi:hypothetical protein